MTLSKKIISKKDIIIPKGTVFECINNTISTFVYDNYDTRIALNNDTCARIIVSSENKEYFEEIKENK